MAVRRGKRGTWRATARICDALQSALVFPSGM